MIIALIVIISFVLLAYKFFIDRIITEKNIQHEAEIQHQKNITLENVKIQEEERKRMAILLHDDIGNRLNILSLYLRNLNSENTDSTENTVSKQITELIDSARSISHSLYPVNLERLGLILYLEELINNLSASIKISLVVSSKYAKKDIFSEVQIYRIIQEFSTNVIKHSTATEITVYLRENQNDLAVLLRDNGNGFDYNSVNKGMGLKNIESRMKSLDATYKWKNRKDQRTQLIFRIPK